jgi:hypothetical protein
MCVTYDEDTTVTSTSTTTSGLEEIVVTAPRISINMDTFQNIQWSEVVPLTFLGGVGGIFNGVPGILLGATIGAATGIETQDNVNLVDLLQIENDLVFIPTIPAPYIPMF